MKLSITAFLCTLLSVSTALACGRDSDCSLGERTYRIQMPAGHDGTTPIGAIIHAHGYRGSAAAIMQNRDLTRMASRLGVALVAPKSFGDDWVIPGAPRKRDVDGSVEFGYFDALVTDAATRFPIDKKRLMVSGFSAGGMMVWNLACHRGAMFAGFVPIAGTYWEPLPRDCPSGPVNLIHIHGTADKVVPLEGRPIADTRQGSVTEALDGLRASGGYTPAKAGEIDGLRCVRSENETGNIVQYCSHPGGHSIKSKWLEQAWREFEAIGAL